jgi:MFS family permease
MPAAGRLTDRIGGGRIVVAGLIVMTLATIPFAFIGASTSYVLLAALLVVRGVGLGGAMMPSMAAAYAVLKGPEVPRATSALNVVQRVGGSLGTAILAVALQHELRSALPSGAAGSATGGSLQRLPDQVRARVAVPLADAFGNTFWWAVGMSLIALVPAVWLMRTTRRTPPAAEPEPEHTPAELVG